MRAAVLALAACVAAVPSEHIPVAHTPSSGGPLKGGCGYNTLPPPVLANCTDPLKAGVPDLRGSWQGPGLSGTAQHWERVEQCGDRVTVTSSCVIHDFAHADGTVKHGVHDLSAVDCIPIRVAGLFNATCLTLRPFNLLNAVTRCITPQGKLALDWGGQTTEMERIERPYGLERCDRLPNTSAVL
eukprot:TRINITY_DN10307_c0_g1_i1.p2 TRINITY_DN10307_c0_g1~~TRINITY_DN10307_c0_g1_i1.p2  ORF type:complete len:203 (+),score=56.68 TRINITY_DN10307_c0_g1_i1:57-611(+)